MATILDEPQLYFDLVKEAYPHFHHGTSLKGENMYFEMVGMADEKKLFKTSMTVGGGQGPSLSQL